MGIVYNATKEDQQVRAFGKYFKFAPGKFKMMSENFSTFIVTKKGNQGLVGLSEKFEDPEYQTTPEGKKELKVATEAGVTRYLAWLKSIVDNNLQSLRQDLLSQNITTDSTKFMSEGELKALEILTTYQERGEDKQKKITEKAEKALKELGIETK